MISIAIASIARIFWILKINGRGSQDFDIILGVIKSFTVVDKGMWGQKLLKKLLA